MENETKKPNACCLTYAQARFDAAMGDDVVDDIGEPYEIGRINERKDIRERWNKHKDV